MNEKILDFTKLKVINYRRKSSDSEDRQVLSISSQGDEAERIKEYYKLPNFIEIIEETKSAKKENNRPLFKKMMSMITTGKVDAIVCWKLDRLARNMTEGGQLIDLLSSGILKAIITHDKVYYPSDNVLLMSVEFGQGKQFVKDLSVNVKRGLRKKAENGIPSGVATLGFLNNKTEEKGNRNWKVDEETLKKIKILLEMFLTGKYSASKLHQYAVNELKLTTIKRKRIGGGFITLSRIYEILKDPVYSGFFFQGNERYELHKDLPRLITEAEHEKILRILGKNNIPKIQKHSTLFSGFIKSDKGESMGQDIKYQLICECKNKFAYSSRDKCPKCQKEINKLDKVTYLEYIYYYNVKKKKAKEQYKSITQNKILEELKGFIDENLNFSPTFAEWSKQFIVELKNKEINDKVFYEEQSKKEQEEFERKKRRLREMLRDEQIEEEDYKQDMKSLNERYANLEKKENQVNWFEKMNEIVEVGLSAKEILEKGSIEIKRNLLFNLGSNLVWNEEKLFIYNKKSIEKLIKGLNEIKVKIPEFEPKNNIVFKSSKEKTSDNSPVFSMMLGR